MFNESEIQLLIALLELAEPAETPNNNHYKFYPRTLEEAATYFKSLRQDWSAAQVSLAALGLIQPIGGEAHLTPAGLVEARRLRSARPPIYYWYEEFFAVAPGSAAYSEFCTRLYGRDLCQAGFSDMEQVDALLAQAHLEPGSRALELGCGAGKVAEYLADASGAFLTAIDYSPTAIAAAQERTASKTGRLDFRVANMDELNFSPHSFEAVISIDTLYMPTDLDATLQQVAGMLKPGGRLLAYYIQFIWDAVGERAGLLPENTALGRALARLGLHFETIDFSAATYALMQRKRRLGEEMRPRFEAEGSLELDDFILNESEQNPAPYDPQQAPFTRYLYVVRL